MNKSLLFLPDISGFTKFIQSTEVEHSQHVISELLEELIAANTQELQLAEVEGDALFFYKEEEIPKQEDLFDLVENMFVAFYSHLKLLEKNRICPCNACSTAPNLELKIIVHGGELQFITVQDKRKPFGKQVIEAHRLMKNSVPSDNYVLLSEEITTHLQLNEKYQSKLFNLEIGQNEYDDKVLKYLYGIVDKNDLELRPFSRAKKIEFNKPPSLYFKKNFPLSAPNLLEYITNYSYRSEWVNGVDKFEYNDLEVTRLGTDHVCVINGKHLNFIAITKEGKPGQLVYGEMTPDPLPVDMIYQFYIITPTSQSTCTLELEVYLEAASVFKKILLFLVVKKALAKNITQAFSNLHEFVTNKQESKIS